MNDSTPNESARAALARSYGTLHVGAPPASPARPAGLTTAQQLQQWMERAQREMFTVTVEMTPELAQLLLDNNADNRPLTERGSTNRSVSGYAQAMKRGEWELNGEPIIVARTGELNDGQHRLKGVVLADVTVPMDIKFGVERASRRTLDQGIGRTPGHILHMGKEKNSNALAAAARFMFCLETEVNFGWRPTSKQIDIILEQHPGLRDSVRETLALVRAYGLSNAVAVAHYLCQDHAPHEGQRFLTAVTTGVGIDNVNTPVARLRRVYQEHLGKAHRRTPPEQVASYIKAYNVFLRGKTGPVLWKPDDEPFPIPGKF